MQYLSTRDSALRVSAQEAIVRGLAPQSGLFVPETMAALKGRHLDFVMLDCTCGDEAEGTNHMGFSDDVIMRDRLRENGNVDDSTKLVITHFSHNGHLLHEELEKLANPEGFDVAYDGVVYEI